MSRDTEELLVSVLNSVTNDLDRLTRDITVYSNDVADKLERNFNLAAQSIRQAVHDTPWIPNAIKPPPPPLPKCPAHHLPSGYFESALGWIDRHRALTAAVIAFIGTSTFLVWRRRRWLRQKRRARRAANGAKTELIVLAGSPYSPMVRSMALDLEKRGFLVYIPVGSLEEEEAIADLRSAEVHALNFDITSVESTNEMVEKLRSHLANPQRHGTKQLHFASLIILGNSFAQPNGPITSLTTMAWSDVLNAKVLYPISLVRAFVPLLIQSDTDSKRLSGPGEPVEAPTTVVLVTPSTPLALHLPEQAPASMVAASLSSLLKTLRAEVASSSLHITHLRVVDYPASTFLPFSASGALTRTANSPKALPESAPRSPNSRSPSRLRPSQKSLALIELHNGLFDAITGRTRGTAFLGRGARTYALVGSLAPRGLVYWLLGYEVEATGTRRSGAHSGIRGRSSSSGSGGSTSGSAEWEKVATNEA